MAENNMKLLGQEIPMNWPFVFVVISICVLIFAVDKWGNGVERVVHGLFGDITGSSVQGDALIYEFWTPSENTWSKVSEEERKVLESKDEAKWYQTSDDALQRFWKALKSDMGAQGYSRSESYGQGSSEPKWGWVWKVTFSKPSNKEGTKKLQDKFRDIYMEAFKRDKRIYVEIREAAALRK